MRTGLTKQEKTTDIWFDEKDPLIHIRTHNTALKKRRGSREFAREQYMGILGTMLKRNWKLSFRSRFLIWCLLKSCGVS